MKLSEINEYYDEDQLNGVLTIDGHDNAFRGIVDLPGDQLNVAVYDAPTIVKNLMEGDNISFEEAAEFFYYNISGNYQGPQTPLLLNVAEI